MNKTHLHSYFLFFLLGTTLSCSPQSLKLNEEKIIAANKRLENAGKLFLKCTANSRLETCGSEFVKSAQGPYEKNVAANVIYNSLPKTSYLLHKEVFESNPEELTFNLEFAIELHRNGEYKDAAKLYEKCKSLMNRDYTLYTWLADCYINTGEIDRAIMNWDSANHAKNHIGIEQAIESIYGNANQFKRRDSLRQIIPGGDTRAAYALIHLDFNWEYSWWNIGKIGDNFYKEDELLIKKVLEKNTYESRTIQAYIKLKKLSEENLTEEEKVEAIMKSIKEEATDKDKSEAKKANKIKDILEDNKLLFDNKALPANGKILSDIVNLCLENKLIKEDEFLKNRGKEILETALKNKDADMLNLYAYLCASSPDSLAYADSVGWKEFKQERFALGYLRYKGPGLKSTDPLIEKAINDFPNSSKLFLIKVSLLAKEKTLSKKDLVELIRKDFKTIDSGSGVENFGIGPNSYALKSHFMGLKALKQ